MTTPKLMCLSCGCWLLTRGDVSKIGAHGPFCRACVQSAEGMTFAEWLDGLWQRQRPN
jgi:hypothetical protein